MISILNISIFNIVMFNIGDINTGSFGNILTIIENNERNKNNKTPILPVIIGGSSRFSRTISTNNASAFSSST